MTTSLEAAKFRNPWIDSWNEAGWSEKCFFFNPIERDGLDVEDAREDERFKDSTSKK